MKHGDARITHVQPVPFIVFHVVPLFIWLSLVTTVAACITRQIPQLAEQRKNHATVRGEHCSKSFVVIIPEVRIFLSNRVTNTLHVNVHPAIQIGVEIFCWHCWRVTLPKFFMTTLLIPRRAGIGRLSYPTFPDYRLCRRGANYGNSTPDYTAARCSSQGHCLQPGDASGAADAAVGTVLIVIHKERGQRV